MIQQITLDQYIGKFAKFSDWQQHKDYQDSAKIMLFKVNAFLAHLQSNYGLNIRINPMTKSIISGIEYGGFRPKDCPQGAKNSPHKIGRAVDVYDPDQGIDNLLDKHPELLVQFDLYREHPSATNNWCHLQDKPVASGNRTFYP
jgi:hypothetical protein